MRKIIKFAIVAAVLTFMVVIFMAALPASAETEGNFTYKVKNGEATITDFTESYTGALEIPSTLGVYPVTSIDNMAFYNCSGLISVTIPSSVTHIGASAFDKCDALVKKEDHVSYVDKWIVKCDSYVDKYEVTSVTLRNDTVGIAENAFLNCSIESITIPESVTSICEDAFSDCEKLESVILPSNITEISKGLFRGCGALKNITIPSKVESIGDTAFSGCTSLVNINVPNNVTQIGVDAFSNCEKLESVTLSNNITEISRNMFMHCKSLKNITIPQGVKSIGFWAFYNCRQLAEIVIPDGVTSIDGEAFGGCSGLQSISIADSVQSIAPSAFAECIGIIQTDGGISYVDKWIINCDAAVTSVNLRGNTVGIAYGAFENCSELSEITFPESLKYINDAAFSACTSFEEITLPRAVTSIGWGAFSDCNGLERITILEGVTDIEGYAFSRCDNLTIHCYRYSCAHTYAINNRIPFQFIQKAENAEIPLTPQLKEKDDISVTLVSVAGYEYRIENGEWQTSNTFTNLSPLTSYNFYQRIAETLTVQASTESTPLAVITDMGKNRQTPNVPILKSKTENSLALVSTEGYEYRINDGEWQSSNEFTGLTAGTIYKLYQRIAATDTMEASVSSEALEVTTLTDEIHGNDQQFNNESNNSEQDNNKSDGPDSTENTTQITTEQQTQDNAENNNDNLFNNAILYIILGGCVVAVASVACAVIVRKKTKSKK